MTMKKTSGISGRILTTAMDLAASWENDELTLDVLLDDLRESGAPERAAVSDLLFEYFRHKGFIDGLIQKHAKHERVRQDMRLLVACAATQIFFQTGIAPQSAVNIAVETGKALRGPGGGGFVNAMLRSFLRDKSFDPEKIPVSFPDLLKQRWQAALGEETMQRLTSLFASNPAMTFRLRDESAAAELESAGAVQMQTMDHTGSFRFYEMKDPGVLFSGNYLEKARLYIQDPATALPFSLLEEAPAGYLLDACAAPGGKAVMLADITEPSKVKLTVCDRSQKRLFQLNKNLQRAGVRSRGIAADAVKPPFTPGTFHFILADVPCTNSGVYRRRPDAPWRFTENRLADTVKLQKQILCALSALVKPGGQLLYSTCSIEPEEDDLQIADFLETHSDFVLERSRLLLPSELHDGAYAALLRRKV